MNFFQHECDLVARVPRVKCEKHGVRQVAVPWAREGSGFTLMFEAFVMALVQAMPVSEAAEMVAENDTLVWRMLKHYVDQAQASRCWSEVKHILVDETSARRGQRYVTNVVDADTRELLFMSVGRGSESLEAFVGALRAHQGTPEQIKLIGMDMSPAYQKGAQHFPNARIVFDHFHLMQLAGKALDEVRKQLKREGADLSEGLWALRGNEQTRTEEQKKRRIELITQYPILGRAMALRESFQEALQNKESTALKEWLSWAQRSRLEPFRKMAKTIKGHWGGIVAFLETRMTNGVIEAINGLLQLAKRMARGFRSFENFRTMGYLKAGKLKLALPSLIPT